jgi:hypothetical protein
MPETATSQLVDSFGRTLEENRARYELHREANEEARANWNNPEWRAEFAQDLTESILLGFDYETLVDRWIDTERTDFEGRIFVREAAGLKAFYMARGGYIEASELIAEAAEVPRDMIGVHVYEFDDKFVTNFAESAQTLRDLAIRRMDAEINRRVHTVLAEAIPAGSPYYVATPGVSKPAVDAALRNVSDATSADRLTIVGRSTMVDQISDFDGFGQETLEEIGRRGVIGTYRGATIVRLRNFKDEENQPYIPANEMWVMATDTGKMAFYGGLKSKEFEEQDNWYWHYLARRDTGVLVHHPERARRLVDTNQAA